MTISITWRHWISMRMGAYSADRITSKRTLAADADHPAGAASNARAKQRPQKSDRLRNQQDGHAEPEQIHHHLRVESRPGREQLEVLGEILGADQVRLQREREAYGQQDEPQRRGQVAHDADRQMHAAREAQAGRADHLRVLQVALRPAPIADREVEQRRRGLLPRAAERRRHAHLPAARAAAAPLRRNRATVIDAAERLASRELSAGRSSARTRATRMIALWPQ